MEDSTNLFNFSAKDGNVRNADSTCVGEIEIVIEEGYLNNVNNRPTCIDEMQTGDLDVVKSVTVEVNTKKSRWGMFPVKWFLKKNTSDSNMGSKK